MEAGQGQGPVWAPHALVLNRKKGPVNELRAEQAVSGGGRGSVEGLALELGAGGNRTPQTPTPTHLSSLGTSAD